jgi:hypothetical protein
MKFSWLMVVLTFSVLGCGTAAPQSGPNQLYFVAPSVLAGTQREMKTAGFWIGQHPSPDQVILNAEGIAEFNRHVQDDLNLTTDILNLPAEFSGPKLVEEWQKTLDEFKKKGFYMASGQKANEAFFAKINGQIIDTAVNLKITPQFGFVVHYADQRIFPTKEPLYAKRGDIDFDELQNSTLDVGTPVVVLSTSADDGWLYVESPLSSGWVEADNIATAPIEKLELLINDEHFVVVAEAKADIFLNRELTQYYDYARMGTRLVRNQVFYDKNLISVWLPSRDDSGKMTLVEAYMRLSDVRESYLPYTPRTILEQAFKLLNAPYGWGGMYGEQDCSAFLDEIFATVGIVLPRNSSAQRKTGQLLAEFPETATPQDKLSAFSKAIGGATLLGLKGHILLYLGMVHDRPYAIHAVWAYREPAGKEDRIRVINRVAVSDLSLGKDSQNGSLLKRLKEILIVTNKPQ